jgi:predicted esterase
MLGRSSSDGSGQKYHDRSPLSFVRELATVNLSLHHGRFDRVVHYRHSWKLAQYLEKLGAERFFFEIFDGEHDIHYEKAFQWFDRLLGSGEKMSKMLTG